MQKERRNNRVRHHGFTLVELMVVIVIASVIVAITLGGYRSMADGNLRVSCQTNLSAIYTALRLYADDSAGFFPYHDGDDTLGKGKYIGLWALYLKPSNASQELPAFDGETVDGTQTGLEKPIGIYLRHHKQLHCPADYDNEQRFTGVSTAWGWREFDPNYLSYQVKDGADWTYQSSRTTVTTNPEFKRQLMRINGTSLQIRTPEDSTVVTWCKWHRGSREIDNVLFYDGKVKPVQRLQPDASGTGTLESWHRLP